MYNHLNSLIGLYQRHPNRMVEADGRHCVHYTIILITVNKHKFPTVLYSTLQQMPVCLCTYAAVAHFLEEQLNSNQSS